jgi:hypothetical protein
MSLPITCACGARLEIDEKFAGQTVPCPDCNKPLQIPTAATAVQEAARQTSGWAITSLVLALIGAFTVIGTLLAIGCGIIAQRQIDRQPDKIAGRAYARCGIILGSLLTVTSLLVYFTAEWVGLDALLREPEWAGRLDFSGPLQVTTKHFELTLPSHRWGLLRQSVKEANADTLDESRVFVNVRDDAHVFCVFWTLFRPEDSMKENQERAIERLRNHELPKIVKKGAVSEAKVESATVLAAPKDKERAEIVVQLTAGGQRRKFLLRLDIDRDKLYMIAAGTRLHRYERTLPQLKEIVETFEAK